MNLIKSVTFLLMGAIIGQSLSAGTGLLIARTIGLEGYGQYTTAFALAGAFIHAFVLGIDSILPREIAKDPSSTSVLISSALLPVGIWTLLLVVVIYALGLFLGYSQEILTLLLLIAPIIGIRSLINLMRSAYLGLERMDYDALIQIIENLVAFVLVVIALFISQSILTATLALLMAELGAFIVAIILMRRLAGSLRAYRIQVTKRLVKSAIPLGLTFTIIGINLRLDTLVLSIFRTEIEVALYSAAFGIVMLSSAISLASAALLPRLSSLAHLAQSEFASLWETGLRYTIIISFATGISISMLAPWLIIFLYGSEFLEAVPVLRVLGLLSTFLFINRYLWHVLIALDMQKAITIAVFGALATTLILALLLVPSFGMIGAAMTALGREFCQMLILAYFVSKKTPAVQMSEVLGSPVVASTVLIISLWWVSTSADILTLFVLPPALILYLMVLIATKGIQRRELSLFFSALQP